MTSGSIAPVMAVAVNGAPVGGPSQSSLQSQLAMYAEDFQEIFGRLKELERRHKDLKASHSRLSEAGEVLSRLNNPASELCLVIAPDGQIKYASDSARAVFMLDEAKVVRMQQLMAPIHLSHLDAMLASTAQGGNEFAAERTEFILYPGADPAGARLFATSFLPMDDGKGGLVCWIMRDMSGGAEASSDPERHCALHQDVQQGAMASDLQGRILALDHSFSLVTGYSNADLRGKMPAMISSSSGALIFEDSVGSELRTKGHWRGEVTHSKKDAQALRQWLSVTAVKDSALQTAAYITVFADREVMLSAERTVLDTACHDALTGLPNFSLFQERAGRKITDAWRGGAKVALLSIVLDHLPASEGLEDGGDRENTRETVCTRLLEVIRGCDIMSSPEPDKFFVMLVGALDRAEVETFASRMIAALSLPITDRKQQRRLSTSIGCALFPADGVDTPVLLKNAQTAMLLARQEGVNSCRMYS